ncbi:hypothetical protein AVBRAN9332_09195 [Campylobacter sp. RM9332]|uniref:complement resistance protein TraT n=2 Tax=unclassified Campylobacter TaxID=2593542 RepID=UPI0030149611|nr:hypothetical protein [Campylobacter sp. RM9332]
MKKTILSIVGIGFMFGACASNSLELDTKLNNSIFIEPVAKSKKSIFVFAKNTSDCNVNIESKLIEGLKNKGYTILNEPTNATFIVSTNIVECSKKSEEELKQDALKSINPAFAAFANNKSFASSIINNITGEEYTIELKADVNIKQRSANKVINQNNNYDIKNSNSSLKLQNNSKSQNYESDFIENSTIINAKAKQRNIKLEEVLPILENEMAKKIYNLF